MVNRSESDDDEDLAQEIALARLQAARHGFDPEVAAREARALASRGRYRPEIPATDLSGRRGGGYDFSRLDWIPETKRVRSLAPSSRRDPDLTEGQKRRAMRDAILFAASLCGFTERDIAMGLDMQRSRVHVILASMRERVAGRTGSSE